MDSHTTPKLVSWGANSCGQLGQGRTCEECLTPSSVLLEGSSLEVDHINSVVAGANHSFLLTKDGLVFGCGANSRGQLLELSKQETKFQAIPSLTEFRVLELATKWDTSYAVSSRGSCLCWGPNNFGQQGLSASAKRSGPVQTISSRVKHVAAGLRHILILHDDGSVSSAGDEKKGQLGRPTGSTGLDKVAELDGIVQIACGQNHNLALTSDGKLFGWGCNKFRQVRNSNQDVIRRPSFICDVDSTSCTLLCGWTHSAILKDSGRLASWGRNNYSQLGVLPCDFQPEPQDLKFMVLKDAAFGAEHCLGITADNTLVSWGWNEHGNCGTGDIADVTTPAELRIGSAKKIGAGCGQSFAIVH